MYMYGPHMLKPLRRAKGRALIKEFPHLIFIDMHPSQEDSIVEKLYSMHFPSEAASIETQTQVPWFPSSHFFFIVVFLR